ncbi:MAG: hypothetical protein ACK5N9_09865 [Pirellula sp.]|jgi:hypothetical protein
MINEIPKQRTSMLTFSLKNLLILTVLIAVALAIGLAYKNHWYIMQKRQSLLEASGRLKVSNLDELAVAKQPKTTPDADTWIIFVPEGRSYNLYLGIGEFPSESIPKSYESVSIPSGQHRVTFIRADSAIEDFRYTVYVDGVRVIEKTMGSQWMPNNWRSSSGLPWPNRLTLSPSPLQLAGQAYTDNHDFGHQYSFNQRVDHYVTQKGFRLWVDIVGRTYTPESPFVGFSANQSYYGVGLRDGFRFLDSRQSQYLWAFTLPASGTDKPILHVEPVFYTHDGNILSATNLSFTSWELSEIADSPIPLGGPDAHEPNVRSVFLRAKSKLETPLPVVELKWDANRPDEIGMRLANTTVNDSIERWGFRISDGSEHLWREIQANESKFHSDEMLQSNNTLSKDESIQLPIESDANDPVFLQWKTNETLALQILERANMHYGGFDLYQGLPITFSVQISANWAPSLAVRIEGEDPDLPGDPFPGGAVFDELQLEFSKADRDWLWLQAKTK